MTPTPSPSSPLDLCGAIHFTQEVICQLTMGHDGAHLGDRVNFRVSWWGDRSTAQSIPQGADPGQPAAGPTDEDLRPFGWAPGSYENTCRDCWQHHVADKRAGYCRPCATKSWAKCNPVLAAPAAPVDLTVQDIEGLACLAALKIDMEPRLQFLQEYNRMKADPAVIAWLREQGRIGMEMRGELPIHPGLASTGVANG